MRTGLATPSSLAARLTRGSPAATPATAPAVMLPDDIARVRAAWRLADRGAVTAATLHAHLVASAPTVVARLAAAGVADPAEELLAWVDYVVHLLDVDDALSALAHAAEAFGREWSDLGVTAHDVAAARTALFRTLSTLLGDRLDVRTAAAWASAYTLLAGALYRGLRGVPRLELARAA
jgi:hemoglobin-like flavoprotein